MSFKSHLICYVIGGLTLPPMLMLGMLYIFWKLLPVLIAQDEDKELEEEAKEFSDLDLDPASVLKLTEMEEKDSTGVKAYKAGWITVTREYHTFVSNATDKQLEPTNTENKSAYTALYKLVKNAKSSREHLDADINSSSANSSNADAPKKTRRKNRFYGVLRHGNLFLYKDENQKDVQHVIVLSSQIVTIWPRSLSDGELFTKRSAVCLLKKFTKRRADSPPKHSSASLIDSQDSSSSLEILESGITPPKNMTFYIYADTNYEKEDWYFELIKATKKLTFEPSGTELDSIDPTIYANALHYKTADMISLIQTLHSSEGQLQTRWLNALIGRLFLSFHCTEYFENIVRAKLLKKLAKINKPGFLDEFKVKKIDVGNAAPFISFPKLEDIKPDGSLNISMKFSYTGKLSMQVATKANINLGSRFKTHDITLLLAVTINKIEGPLVISLKPPPSTRIWYTFEKMPVTDLKVEPVVSQRQIKYSVITKAIENKLKDAIRDSLVKPAWDDINFFKTTDEFYRGGIWDTKKRPEPEIDVAEDVDEADLDLDGDAQLFEIESTEINEGASLNADYNTQSDDASLRSRVSNTLKTKSSFTGSLNNLNKKKSVPSISTSNDQFLSNGSFVSKIQTQNFSPVSPAKSTGSPERSFTKSSAMQIISEEASAGKKTISNSLKKFGKWYNDKSKPATSSPVASVTNMTFEPPQMISRRRASSNECPKQHMLPKKKSAGDLVSKSSVESLRRAPLPHTFPAEYLYGLETNKPNQDNGTKHVPPPKIADMKSPYMMDSNLSSESLQPALGNFRKIPQRKPVDEAKFSSTQRSSGSMDTELSTENDSLLKVDIPYSDHVPDITLQRPSTDIAYAEDLSIDSPSLEGPPELPPRENNNFPLRSPTDTISTPGSSHPFKDSSKSVLRTPSSQRDMSPARPPLPPRESPTAPLISSMERANGV